MAYNQDHNLCTLFFRVFLWIEKSYFENFSFFHLCLYLSDSLPCIPPSMCTLICLNVCAHVSGYIKALRVAFTFHCLRQGNWLFLAVCSSLSGLWAAIDSLLPSSHLTARVLGLLVHGDLNWGPNNCVTSSLPKVPPSQPSKCHWSKQSTSMSDSLNLPGLNLDVSGTVQL